MDLEVYISFIIYWIAITLLLVYVIHEDETREVSDLEVSI